MSRIEQLERRVEQLQKIQGTNYTLATLTSLMEESVETSISRLSAFDSTVTSQFVSVQNLIQSMSSVQNNLREDLDRLRSVDLYQSCSQDTRSCTMSTGGNSNYYWRSCSTSGVSIKPNCKFQVCEHMHVVRVMCTAWTLNLELRLPKFKCIDFCKTSIHSVMNPIGFIVDRLLRFLLGST